MMIQANLFIYLFTILAAMSMAYSSYQRRILPVARPLGSLALLWVVFSLFRAFDLLNIDISQGMSQLLVDFDALFLSFFIPLWVWLLVEFYQEGKTHLDENSAVFLL